MINFRVNGLDSLLKVLEADRGAKEEYDQGKFSWVGDPEENKIELCSRRMINYN